MCTFFYMFRFVFNMKSDGLSKVCRVDFKLNEGAGGRVKNINDYWNIRSQLQISAIIEIYRSHLKISAIIENIDHNLKYISDIDIATLPQKMDNGTEEVCQILAPPSFFITL